MVTDANIISLILCGEHVLFQEMEKEKMWTEFYHLWGRVMGENVQIRANEEEKKPPNLEVYSPRKNYIAPII